MPDKIIGEETQEETESPKKPVLDRALDMVRDQKRALHLAAPPTTETIIAIGNLTMAEAVLLVGKEITKHLDTISYQVGELTIAIATRTRG